MSPETHFFVVASDSRFWKRTDLVWCYWSLTRRLTRALQLSVVYIEATRRRSGAAGSSGASQPQGSILSSGYFPVLSFTCSLCIHVGSLWLSALPLPYKNMAVNGLATLNCPAVWVRECVHVWWTAVDFSPI